MKKVCLSLNGTMCYDLCDLREQGSIQGITTGRELEISRCEGTILASEFAESSSSKGNG